MKNSKALCLAAALASLFCGTLGCGLETDTQANSEYCKEFDTSFLSQRAQAEWEQWSQLYYSNGTCPTLRNFVDWQNSLDPSEKPWGDWDQPHLPPAKEQQDSLPDANQLNPAKPYSNSQPKPGRDVQVPPHGKVYRNSRAFEGLSTNGLITPGGKYYTDNGSCSFGWSVTAPDQPGKLYNLTAGHCGSAGDTVYTKAAGADYVAVGDFIVQHFDEFHDGQDYGLIELYPKYHNQVINTPAVSIDSKQIILKGWARAAWIEQNQPYICNLGYRSGLSCGSYREILNQYTLRYDGIMDHGDSGGVVWARDPADPSGHTIYAIAITSFTQLSDATNAGAKMIEPMMDKYGFSILE